MEIINSLNNPLIKKIKKLRQSKYRKIEKEFIVESLHLIEEAARSKQLKYIITCNLEFSFPNYKIIYVSENIIKHLSNMSTFNKYLGIVSIDEKNIDYQDNIIVLDQIQDPGNLGSILRSALAFNFKNIIISNDSVDLYNEKVIQSSQGSIFNLNIKRSNLINELEMLKEHNYLLVGSSLDKSITLNIKSNLKQKYALFFGNEGQGISKEILKELDILYKIDITNIDSLNVGVAAGIFMYQLSNNK